MSSSTERVPEAGTPLPVAARPRAGQVVLVTGGSSGVGLATALQLADEGADLVLASRGVEALERAANRCRAAGAEVLAVPTDVADPDAVDALFDAAVQRFGHVDGVVHAAGVLAYGRFEDVPHEVFRRVVDVNLVGTANVARAALRVFGVPAGGDGRTEPRGRLVVLGSVIGKIATAYMSNYQTSKWGVHGLVRALQVEARRTPGVQISLVSPGGVDTPIYTQAGNYAGWEGRPPPPVYSAERVARRVVRALDEPRREISVGYANWLMVAGFRALPGVYDRIVTPLMRGLAMSSREVGPHDGNTGRPLPDGEQLRGSWLPRSPLEVARLLRRA
jgi:NAD(P)-dependent dehydrogenase (short-subunit alcohol dehydrogenase family)